MTEQTAKWEAIPKKSLSRKIRRGIIRRASNYLLPDRYVVRQQFKGRNGRYPDLKNPRTLAEKLCWLNLYYDDPLQAQCADKLAVRAYVAEAVGEDHLIPLLMACDRPEQVSPQSITADEFVLKTTHDSASVVICKDRSKFDWDGAKRFLRQRMRRNHYLSSRERIYRHIKPRIAVEKLVKTSDDSPLVDFKLWCFGGKVEMIGAAVVTHGPDGRRTQTQSFYDTHWREMNVHRQYPPVAGGVPRPANLEGMIRCAEQLSAPFPFCRTDLYNVDGRILFGELTFLPSSGTKPFQPPSEELRLGDLLILPRGGDAGRTARPAHAATSPSR